MAISTVHASAFTNTTGFNANFSTPENAYSSNDQYATVTGDANPRNDSYATNWRGFAASFSSEIPDGSTINSVHLHIEHKLSANWSLGNIYTSVWADVTAAAALATGVTGSIGDTQYGHSTSTGYLSDTDWDVTLTTLPTVAELKGTNFGCRVQADWGNDPGAYTVSVDDIYFVVDYTAPAAGPTAFAITGGGYYP